MKVLVIGGSGFIGTRLIGRLLADGHAVTNLDLLPPALAVSSAVSSGDGSGETAFESRIGDINDRAAVRAAATGADVVVNLAAEHRDDVRPLSRYDLVNVQGSATVVDVATELGIEQLVFTSSVALYGLDVDDPSEVTPAAPFNDYGRTKYEAEQLFRDWAAADPARGLLIVRPSVVFGEGNRGNVYNLVKQIAAGRFVRVGDGGNRKSMAYVGNLVQFVAGQLPVPPGARVFNYADKPDLTTKELVGVVYQALGSRRITLPAIPLWLGLAAGSVIDGIARVTRRTFPVSRIRIRKFAADTRINADAVRATGFSAETPLPDALRRTIKTEFPAAR